MEQNMFIRILNSEMELATGCTEPGAVALTAAEAGQALRKAGVDKAEEITVNASINIIKNAMSAGIPGTDYEGMDYAAAIGALGGRPGLSAGSHEPRPPRDGGSCRRAGQGRQGQGECGAGAAEALHRGHCQGRRPYGPCHCPRPAHQRRAGGAGRCGHPRQAGHGHCRRRRQRCGHPGADRVLPDRPLHLGLLHQRARPDERPHRHHPQCREGELRHQR